MLFFCAMIWHVAEPILHSLLDCSSSVIGSQKKLFVRTYSLGVALFVCNSTSSILPSDSIIDQIILKLITPRI